MTDVPPAQSPDRGRVDAEGRLVSADPRLAALNARAGGELGEVLAVPQLRGIVRLARRLRVTIARPAIAADGDRDLELWVRARLEGDIVELVVAGWRTLAPARPPQGEERLADFLRAEADFMWESDAGLRLTMLSPGGVRIIGGAVGEAVGTPLGRLFRLGEDEGGELPLIIALAEQAPFAGQHAVARRSGRAVMLAGLPLRDAGGAFAGFRGAGVSLDPDPLPAPDDAAAVAARLDAALRRPLDRIVAHAEAIRAQMDGPVGEDYLGYAGDIAGAGRHLLALISDLVDLEAIERADFRPPSEAIDLAVIARNAVALLAAQAAERNIRVERPGEQETLPARGDGGRALQILVNLVGNALRFSETGTTVRVSLRTSAGEAQVRVADEGPGIARKDQERMFEKFERLGAAQPGTGLGLYIARRLARAMGGEVGVDSKRGKGARFTLSLPEA